jgi:nucleoside-diphosphate-sugar epimerase
LLKINSKIKISSCQAEINNMSLTVLTGATGFIGSYVLDQFLSDGKKVRALTRNLGGVTDRQGVEWIVGDIMDPAVWGKLLEPGCTVVHLAYSDKTSIEEALKSVHSLILNCAKVRISRLIHLSSISVCGRTQGGLIDESTVCNPTNNYGRKKFAIEHAIREGANNNFELAVVRPTNVFGNSGLPLKSLSRNLISDSHLSNYLRSSLFGSRAMHLVPVETVAAAISFLCSIDRPLNNEVFIVSEDLDPINNFQYVEQMLMRALGVSNYLVPPIPLPGALLSILLRLRGRSEIDPYCIYLSSKIKKWGFMPPINLITALQEYAVHIRNQN